MQFALIVSALLAIRTIWSARPSAPIAIALNGFCAFGRALALPSSFPLGNATTEELTVLDRNRYPAGLGTIAACVFYLRRTLQQVR